MFVIIFFLPAGLLAGRKKIITNNYDNNSIDKTAKGGNKINTQNCNDEISTELGQNILLTLMYFLFHCLIAHLSENDKQNKSDLINSLTI